MSSQIEKIISKNVYQMKRSKVDIVEYQVKYLGESYLNTKWMNRNDIQGTFVEEYEANVLKKLILSEQIKRIEHKSTKSTENNLLKTNLSLSKSQDEDDVQSDENELIREQKSFSIRMNTEFDKQKNHHVFCDRLKSIKSQIHQFYQKCENSLNPLKYNRKLITQIQIQLGNQQIQSDNNYLKSKIFPQITELMKFQKSKRENTVEVVYLQVQWQDKTISKEKAKYLSEYQPELYDDYRANRDKISRKWKKQNKIQQKNSNQQTKEQKTQTKDGKSLLNSISQSLNSISQEQSLHQFRKRHMLQKKPLFREKHVRGSSVISHNATLIKEINGAKSETLNIKQYNGQNKSIGSFLADFHLKKRGIISFPNEQSAQNTQKTVNRRFYNCEQILEDTLAQDRTRKMTKGLPIQKKTCNQKIKKTSFIAASNTVNQNQMSILSFFGNIHGDLNKPNPFQKCNASSICAHK